MFSLTLESSVNSRVRNTYKLADPRDGFIVLERFNNRLYRGVAFHDSFHNGKALYADAHTME